MKIIRALIKSIQHKYTVESGLRVQVTDTLTSFRYPFNLTHPWPREFTYRIEFFTNSANTKGVVTDIQNSLSVFTEEHVLNVFSENGDEVACGYSIFGYQFAWSNILLSKEIEIEENDQFHSAGAIQLASSARDIERINAFEPENLSYEPTINDPDIHDYVIEIDGLILGKAQLVTYDDQTAYVSDMFVKPENRGLGFGGDLLRQLHLKASSLGIREIILIPSLMTRQMGFYEKFGYEEIIPMHLFIPDGKG